MTDTDATTTPSITTAELQVPSFGLAVGEFGLCKQSPAVNPGTSLPRKKKCVHVVAALPSDITDAEDDLITGAPSHWPYDDLKRTVLPWLEPSHQSKLVQLLSEELGD